MTTLGTMRKASTLFVGLLLLMASVVVAQAQWRWPTPDGSRERPPLSVMGCINDLGFAVPVTVTGNPCPTGSGGGGAGDASAANQTAVIGSKDAGTAAASSLLVGGVHNTSLPTLTNGQQAGAQFDSSGRLIAVVQGTVAATQSGTWTVQPGNTANSTAWLVTGTGGTFPVTGTFWQATQPVSGTVTANATLAAETTKVIGTVNQGTSPWVVSGTVTANIGTVGTLATLAKQPALGTAGTASTDVITVQGIASMTPLLTVHPSGTYTNRSGTIATGGTSQTLMASNANRRRVLVQNPCSATAQGIATAESIFLNFTSAATVAGGDSIELLPCGAYDSSSGPVTTEAITIIAATSAHKYVAKEQ